MKLATYFKQDFPKHLSQLQFRPVNQVLKDLFHDPLLVLFGGRDWSHVQQDLAPIPRHQRAHFVYALLTIVLTDQCIQTYFKTAYPAWREATAYPKFGWSGFGLHNENPYKLIAVAESSGLVDRTALHALMPEFVEFLQDVVTAHFTREMPTVDVRQFFRHLLNDDINAFQSGMVLPALQAMARGAWLGKASGDPQGLAVPAAGVLHWRTA